MTVSRRAGPRTEEWQHGLLIALSGLLLFETLTGLAILLLKGGSDLLVGMTGSTSCS